MNSSYIIESIKYIYSNLLYFITNVPECDKCEGVNQ